MADMELVYDEAPDGTTYWTIRTPTWIVRQINGQWYIDTTYTWTERSGAFPSREAARLAVVRLTDAWMRRHHGE